MNHNCTNLQSLLNMQQVTYAMWGIKLKTAMGETFEKYISTIKENMYF